MYVCMDKEGDYFGVGNDGLSAFEACAKKVYDNCGDQLKLTDCQFVSGTFYKAKLVVEAPVKKVVAKKTAAQKR